MNSQYILLWLLVYFSMYIFYPIYVCRKAVTAWKDHASLINLGNMDAPRLPIFSFMVYHKQSGRFLHHNYVSTLLNDLFGVQARGGCACAGPYAMV